VLPEIIAETIDQAAPVGALHRPGANIDFRMAPNLRRRSRGACTAMVVGMQIQHRDAPVGANLCEEGLLQKLVEAVVKFQQSQFQRFWNRLLPDLQSPRLLRRPVNGNLTRTIE